MARDTQADVDTLLAKMAAERTSLREGAAALSAAAAGVPLDGEGEEQWSATEQLAHLWEMERTDLAWCRAALAQNGADLTGLQSDPVAIPVQDAPRHTGGDFLPHLRAERARTEEFIRSLSPADFERTARSAIFGERTVMQWLRSFYRHDRQHSAPIAGRRSDDAPQFQSGVEPNQRRQRIQAVARRASGATGQRGPG